uniref:Phosvitin n=1 Tax=Accipiter nisus TaxID=211598 RepID=A0A8B9MGW8_9AVES
MKGLILALVLALVGKLKLHQHCRPVFHTGKTYLYGYESFILHGLPSRGLAMAGVRLTCKLEISYVSHSDHLLQIRSPKLEEYNGFWPTDPFTASSRLTETIAACFSQAFKFEYTDGRVGSIFAPEDCPILCTNLVRGILNMMQITIKKSQNVYELQEAGIEGICQTRYVIQDDSKNNRAIISKSKDLMDCQEKAVKNMGMAYIRPCPTCPLKARNVKGTVMFTYKMKYDGSGALMTSAMSEQVYQISPFNEPNGAAVMEARQELSLVDIKRTPISAPKTQLQNQGSLRYHFSGELLQMPIPLIRIKNTDLQLTETLRQLVQNNEEGATKEASAKFLQMVQLFRIVTLDQIESLWMQFANDLPYRHWFLSAICAAGATDTFRFLKQKIHDEKLNIWEAAATLPLAFHFVTPNKQTLEVASTFLTCPQIQKAPMHRVIVYLGYGSMVNKYCAQTSLCPYELLQPLHNLATEATSKGDAKGVALALKAIGNAGEPASIKRILKFLPTFSPAAASLPNRIHANAMLALRKIARKDPVKIALQVFMDNTLAPNVRMVACVVLFETKPGLPTVTAMAISLLTEPSLQVASFTYSHMKALAVGRIPQLYNLSAACNIAIKLLSPRLDRLSYRYSKVIHVGDYSFEYQAGAIWRVYLMNSPSTMFPSDIITKVRGYYANTATDIIEVALQSQGLTKLIRKQNIPFAEYDTYRTLKELGKTVCLHAPFCLQYTVTANAIQQIMMPVVKKVVEEVQRGISGRWTLPAMVGELRHIVPTVVGVPLELSLCGVALAQAAISPPLSDNFRPSQLLETKMDIHADIKPKAYFHMIAMMGINTQYFQSGLEFHAEFSANTTMKFDAKIDMKEKNLKIETPPCHQEVELAAVRYRKAFYAISRNMEEIDYEKKSQLLPKGEVPNISDEPFQPSESSSRPGSWKQSSEEAHHDSIGGRFYARNFCRKFESLGCSACLSLKSQNSAFLRNTYLHKLIGELEAKILLKPVHTDADIDKIQLEIQAGSKAASKVIDVASSGPKEEDETSLYEDIQAKLKKILGIENVFQVANKTRRRKKRIHSKEKIAVMDLWAKPSASPLSSSSSSSTASSADGKEPGNEYKKDEIRQSGKKRGSSSKSSSSSSSGRRSSSSSVSTTSSKVCSSSKDHSGDRHCSENTEYSNQKPKFLGDSKPPILAAVLRAIHRNKQPTGLQLVLYTDTQPMRSRIQFFVSSITGSSRWKLCADASAINSHKVSGSLKWGEDCQDYQIATQIATGQYAAYPAMQVKLEWPKVPSIVRTTARWFYSFLPGAAYVLGYSQRQQRGPSHWATLVMALTSPRTCDVVLKLPELTIYDRAIRLPLPFPSSPGTPISTLPSSDWNVFSQATLSVIENLKARCSVFQNTITTFNGVEFNYSMPANCYHVLVQDCSPELKFLVMMKRLEESADLTAINVRLASHEVDMCVSNGLIQLKINGVQAPTDKSLFAFFVADASMLISSEKEGLSLKAPDYGIDKLYYDGHRLEIQVAFWMAGKTCGICGKYDAEKEREYQMPSGYLAKDAVSFGQSWIISEDPCSGGTKILIYKRVPVHNTARASRCHSVTHRERLPGLTQDKTPLTPPLLPRFSLTASALSLEGQTRLDQKSEDVVSTVSAHTACSCQQQPCPA